MTDSSAPYPTTANIQWDENGVPVSETFGDVYYSKGSGIEESRYVFIESNQLPSRWQKLTNDSRFSIAETGFGTGLNFLLAWQLWLSHTQLSTLHYYSVEKFPLTRQDLTQALHGWPQLQTLAEQLIAQYPPQPSSGFHRIVFEQGRVVLTLFFGDAIEGLEELSPNVAAGTDMEKLSLSFGPTPPTIDAWFLDGFAPAKNPEMWNADLFGLMAKLSSDTTSLATFTAAGFVRRGLIEVGFQCKKQAGFGTKREMLIGRYVPKPPSVEPHSSTRTGSLWHLQTRTAHPINRPHCIVIGGGIAGCQTAFALANRQCRVTLIEREPQLATQASGNKQGVVYAKLSPHLDRLSHFNITALLFANQFYQRHGLYNKCGEQCGVMHVADNIKSQKHYQQLAHIYAAEPNFIQWLTPQQSAQISGCETNNPALFVPNSGWLSPSQLCKTLCDHPLITTRVCSDALSLQHEEGTWNIHDAQKDMLAQGGALIIANAFDATQFTQTSYLPLKTIRGQVTQVPSTPASQNLRTVICGDGYVTPEYLGEHSLGATFTLDDTSHTLKQSDQQKNIDRLAALAPNLADTLSLGSHTQLTGKVGFRCTTPDYFPIVGPVPEFENMRDAFSILRKKAKASIDASGIYWPNLYCNVGYGSRALCYSPLNAELLASVITGEFLPLSQTLYRHLHPGRFIIKDLIRGKI